ncbi:MAG: selenide, water dikinase SelD [Gammaproteobacteria bacterium]
MAVTGVVHPDRIWRNTGARPGDALILTKPIGSGVLLNANLKGWVPGDDLAACLASLETLNRRAAEIAQEFEIHAATDVTGFGMAGHALEMSRGAEVTFEIGWDHLPVFPSALDMYERGMSTGSNATNQELAAPYTAFSRDLASAPRSLLYDPQTNGGLLFAVPAEVAADLVAALKRGGVTDATVIGSVHDRDPGSVYLRIV